MDLCTFVLVLMVTIQYGNLAQNQPEELRINFNLNNSPNVGRHFGRGLFKNEEEADTKFSKDSTCPPKRSQRNELKMEKKRILGGFTYNPKNWKAGEPDWEHWTASIEILGYERTPSGKFKKHLCSGVLISKRHILTALHCITDTYNSDYEKRKLLYPPENLEIFFDVNNARVWSGTSFDAIKFFYVNMEAGKVEYYAEDRDNIKDDIAVIELDREATWKEDCLRPIKITNQPLMGNFLLPGQYWIAGWGIYNFAPGQNPDPDFLQYTNHLRSTPCPTVDFVSFDKCICFERTNNYATCLGDSGSPGIIQNEVDVGDDSWYLQGIYVANEKAPGYKTPNCNETRSIGVDINVFLYREKIVEWIKPYILS